MPIPKSSHLILLVGSNPIPNAVATKLLAQLDAKITLIYTKKLPKVADRLKTWIENLLDNYQVQLQGPIDESSAADIQKAIEQALQSGQRENKNTCVGLHYTGGTKAMSVHAYRALERWCEKNHLSKPTCSYLDPRKLELIFDPGGQSPAGQRERLIDEPRLTLQDMLELHGWKKEKGNEPKMEPLLPKTAQALLQIHQDDQSLQAWDFWLTWVFIPATYTHKKADETIWVPVKKDTMTVWFPNPLTQQADEVIEEINWQLLPDAQEKNKIKGLNDVSITWPEQECLSNFVQILKQELSPGNEQNFNDQLNFNLIGNVCALGVDSPKKRREHFAKWLLGEWLESATLTALNQCKKQDLFHECYMDLQAKMIKPPEQIDPNFQLDVIALRGYRLFAFSCTTETEKNLIKLKLFEVYLRARQLGGDQARVAMIACCEESKAKTIQAEVLRDLEEMGVNTRVFGRDCLDDLAGHITNWIRNLEQPA